MDQNYYDDVEENGYDFVEYGEYAGGNGAGNSEYGDYGEYVGGKGTGNSEYGDYAGGNGDYSEYGGGGAAGSNSEYGDNGGGGSGGYHDMGSAGRDGYGGAYEEDESDEAEAARLRQRGWNMHMARDKYKRGYVTRDMEKKKLLDAKAYVELPPIPKFPSFFRDEMDIVRFCRSQLEAGHEFYNKQLQSNEYKILITMNAGFNITTFLGQRKGYYEMMNSRLNALKKESAYRDVTREVVDHHYMDGRVRRWFAIYDAYLREVTRASQLCQSFGLKFLVKRLKNYWQEKTRETREMVQEQVENEPRPNLSTTAVNPQPLPQVAYGTSKPAQYQMPPPPHPSLYSMPPPPFVPQPAAAPPPPPPPDATAGEATAVPGAPPAPAPGATTPIASSTPAEAASSANSETSTPAAATMTAQPDTTATTTTVSAAPVAPPPAVMVIAPAPVPTVAPVVQKPLFTPKIVIMDLPPPPSGIQIIEKDTIWNAGLTAGQPGFNPSVPSTMLIGQPAFNPAVSSTMNIGQPAFNPAVPSTSMPLEEEEDEVDGNSYVIVNEVHGREGIIKLKSRKRDVYKTTQPSNPTNVSEFMEIMDVVSLNTNRTVCRMVERFDHTSTVSILRAISVRWRFELDVSVPRVDATFNGLQSTVFTHFKGLPLVLTIGVGRHQNADLSRRLALASTLASLAHMMIIPFEMIQIIQDHGDQCIDAVIYACRERFSFFAKLSFSARFEKLAVCQWPEGCEPIVLEQWSCFVHQMRETGVKFWRSHRTCRLPFSMFVPISHLHRTFEFKRDSATFSTDWSRMVPQDDEKLPGSVDVIPDTRYGLFEFERQMFKKNHPYKDKSYSPLPRAELENGGKLSLVDWFAMRDLMRADESGEFYSDENRDFLAWLSKIWKKRIVYSHTITMDTFGSKARWGHEMTAQFEGIPYFFLGAKYRDLSPQRCVQRLQESLVYQLSVLRIVPLEMNLTRVCFGNQWDLAVIHACRYRFASFETLLNHSTFIALHNEGGATLTFGHPKFEKAEKFVLRMRAMGRKYWNVRSVIDIPADLPFPEQRLAASYFLYKQTKDDANFEVMRGGANLREFFDERDLALEKSESTPQWELTSDWEIRRNAWDVIINGDRDLNYEEVLCEEYLALWEEKTMKTVTDIEAERVKIMVYLLKFIAQIFDSTLLVDRRRSKSKSWCRFSMSGDMEDVLSYEVHGDGDDLKGAYIRAAVGFYGVFMQYAVVVPFLDEFCLEDESRMGFVAAFLTKTAKVLRDKVEACKEHKIMPSEVRALVRKENLATWREEKLLVASACAPNDDDDFMMLNVDKMTRVDLAEYEKDPPRMAEMWDVERVKAKLRQERKAEEEKQRRAAEAAALAATAAASVERGRFGVDDVEATPMDVDASPPPTPSVSVSSSSTIAFEKARKEIRARLRRIKEYADTYTNAPSSSEPPVYR